MNNFIVSSANTAEIINPTAIGYHNAALSSEPFHISQIFNALAAAITGIANKNEKFNDCRRDKPNNSAAAIVIPALDVPGISARVWAKPMMNACLRFIVRGAVVFLRESANHNTNAKIIVAVAITSVLRNWVATTSFQQCTGDKNRQRCNN